MSPVKILVRKELANAFNSWSTYIGYLLFFCICGYLTWISGNNLFYQGQANLLPFFNIVSWTQFFLISALTMKSIADEKRSGTIELMLTKPIKISELIAGKFLSDLTITVLALCLTLPYYATIACLGNIDHGATILGYFGLIWMGACYISIGLFASAISRTPVTAFFISFGIGISFQFLFGLLNTQMGTGFLASLFCYLSMEEHFDALSRGVLDSRDLIYFSSVILIFLTLSQLSVYKSRA